MELRGRQILITGASRGIGLSIAEKAAERGGELHLVSRGFPEGLRVDLLEIGAQSVRLWPEDLSEPESCRSLCQKLEVEGCEIDILVNNAGQLTGGLLENQEPDKIELMLKVNLSAPIQLTRSLLPGMLRRRSGLIVNNPSVSGKMFFPCASTYAASKTGLVAFTESIKQELRGTGVKTLLLITPSVETKMYNDIGELYGENLDLSFMKSIPSEEWATRAIEGNEETLWPQGMNRTGVWLGHHLPGFFENLVKKKFSRTKNSQAMN